MSKKCPKCGVTSDNGNFCQNCGEKLIENSFSENNKINKNLNMVNKLYSFEVKIKKIRGVLDIYSDKIVFTDKFSQQMTILFDYIRSIKEESKFKFNIFYYGDFVHKFEVYPNNCDFDLTEAVNFIQDKLVIKDYNFPQVFNCTISESLTTIYRLEDKISFKKDISSLNTNTINENGLLIVYENFIRIDNIYFNQNIHLKDINDFKVNDDGYSWQIILNDTETINLLFTSEEGEINKILAYLIMVKNLMNNTLFMGYVEGIIDNQPIKNGSVDFSHYKNMNNTNKEKSVFVSVILHFLFPGLGYIPINHFRDCIGSIIGFAFLFYFRNIFLISNSFTILNYREIQYYMLFIIAIFWICVLFDTIKSVNRYNEQIQ